MNSLGSEEVDSHVRNHFIDQVHKGNPYYGPSSDIPNTLRSSHTCCTLKSNGRKYIVPRLIANGKKYIVPRLIVNGGKYIVPRLIVNGGKYIVPRLIAYGGKYIVPRLIANDVYDYVS